MFNKKEIDLQIEEIKKAKQNSYVSAIYSKPLNYKFVNEMEDAFFEKNESEYKHKIPSYKLKRSAKSVLKNVINIASVDLSKYKYLSFTDNPEEDWDWDIFKGNFSKAGKNFTTFTDGALDVLYAVNSGFDIINELRDLNSESDKGFEAPEKDSIVIKIPTGSFRKAEGKIGVYNKAEVRITGNKKETSLNLSKNIANDGSESTVIFEEKNKKANESPVRVSNEMEKAIKDKEGSDESFFSSIPEGNLLASKKKGEAPKVFNEELSKISDEGDGVFHSKIPKENLLFSSRKDIEAPRETEEELNKVSKETDNLTEKEGAKKSSTLVVDKPKEFIKKSDKIEVYKEGEIFTPKSKNKTINFPEASKNSRSIDGEVSTVWERKNNIANKINIREEFQDRPTRFVGNIYRIDVNAFEVLPKRIPLQFNLEIDSQTFSANYNSTSFQGRVGAIKQYINTDSLELTVKTSYLIDGEGYSAERLKKIREEYEDLVFPESVNYSIKDVISEDEKVFNLRPPIINIAFNQEIGLNTNYVNSNFLTYYDKDGDLKYRNFVVTDVSIDRKIEEFRYDIDEKNRIKDSKGFEVSLSLLEVDPLYNQAMPSFKDYWRD